MASINTMANNTKDKEIERLWVMGGASVMKDRNTGSIVAYTCYCNGCKEKSIKGDGGIAFQTAEDLLVHRNMKAFECPGGCGFHICEEFGSIVRHLDAFHNEMLDKLEAEGLDLTTKKRVWIYPDFVNNTYTLTKPMPAMEASPLENAGFILAMIKPPVRVAASPSPSPGPEAQKKQKQKQKYVPFTREAFGLADPKVASKPTTTTTTTTANPPKTWSKTEKKNISFFQVITEQQEEAEADADVVANPEYGRPTHYAQEDMRKEIQCQYGKGCVKRDRPFACALNHDDKGDIIKRGTELTDDILCPFERPPFKRCGDGRCTKIHLEHRAEFIEQKKKQFFDANTSNNMSYSSVAGTLKKETTTAVITTSAEGTTIMMSREDALAVAAALQELDKKHEEEEDEWNRPRKIFDEPSSEKVSDDEADEEDNEDLTDPATFAARAARMKMSSNS